jgi:hypothetical protein
MEKIKEKGHSPAGSELGTSTTAFANAFVENPPVDQQDASTDILEDFTGTNVKVSFQNGSYGCCSKGRHGKLQIVQRI